MGKLPAHDGFGGGRISTQGKQDAHSVQQKCHPATDKNASIG